MFILSSNLTGCPLSVFAKSGNIKYSNSSGKESTLVDKARSLSDTTKSVTANGGARELSTKEVRADVRVLMRGRTVIRTGNKIKPTLTRVS